MKLTTRCGTRAVDGLNEALLAKAAEANCCARRGCVPTPRSCRRTWPIPRIPVCWPRRFGGSLRLLVESRPPVGRPGPACVTAAGRRANAHMPSRRSCGCAPRSVATRLAPPSCASPVTWPDSLSRPHPMPSGCWPTLVGRCAARAPGLLRWPRPGDGMPRRAGAVVGYAVPSMT